jgi:hypothetical protein
LRAAGSSFPATPPTNWAMSARRQSTRELRPARARR